MALDPLVSLLMVVFSNVPEQDGAMGERMVRTSLTRPDLSSASFPTRRVVGHVSP